MEIREHVEALGDLWLWVAEAGPSEAPPVLLLHGLYDRWETWEPIVPALAERFRVIAFDLRGHGRSSQPAGGYALRDYADDAARLLARLRLAQPVVAIGFSLGALVALVLAAEHPHAVCALVLEDPPLAPPNEATRLWLEALLAAKRAGIEAAYELARELDPDGSPEEWQRSALWLCSTADGPILALLDEGRQPEPLDLLPRVTQPVLLLQADPAYGGVLDDETAERALALLPQGVRKSFPGCGHALHRECTEAFVAAVLDFLDRLERPAWGEAIGQERPGN
ncbi:MAG: alpha/beta fold hydrolase [Thermomicrobium sp.]|nr:alpha/beta fold hydrolase [Thermomicrobium sp.]